MLPLVKFNMRIRLKTVAILILMGGIRIAGKWVERWPGSIGGNMSFSIA